MDKIIYLLKIIRNVFFMWCISFGFLSLMTFISYKFRLSSAIIYIMIVMAYILGAVTGGLFSAGVWTAVFCGATFIASIKLVESICGKGDVYHQNFVVYVLIIVGCIFGYYVKR